MTHRTHLDMFGAHYYPPVFGGRWIDEWVTAVYGGVPIDQQALHVAGAPSRRSGGSRSSSSVGSSVGSGESLEEQRGHHPVSSLQNG